MDGRREPTLNRLFLSIRAWWRTLTDREFAQRVDGLFSSVPSGPDLRVLAVLQRDGRLVDFLMEDIDPYTDTQIGAAVRDIHSGCRKALREYLSLEPVMPGQEESAVTVPPGFDPAAVRLTGQVTGNPPFSGRLKHHGWRVKSVQLPALPGSRGDQSIVAPAEVEIG
jgi:hypothetical protein